MKVEFYTSASDKAPVLEYVRGLPKDERARLFEAFKQIEESGFDAVRVVFRQIDGKLWEIKVSRHRVFYVMIKEQTMILLHAYKKQG
jgi:phage-related protein